ncbi:MAG TPA: hypothetical protein VJ827_03260 [Rubrobacter sp.]|nr:hypothetical protein [Rubrobacter sp.]
MSVRAVLCHCRKHLEAGDEGALHVLVRDHLEREHPSIPPSDEQVEEIISTRAYDLQYVGRDGIAEDFGPEPY